MTQKESLEKFRAVGSAGRARSAALGVLLAAAWLGFAGSAAAGSGPNPIPFDDTFENYANLTPLIDGTNGWYASSNAVIVQNAIYYDGAQAAMVPANATLSNRFLSTGYTNIWVQADVRMVLSDDDLGDDADPPRSMEVDNTNVAALLYVNTSGYFVVHNGAPGPSTTNSTNWVSMSSANQPNKVADGDWVRVLVHLDYRSTNWTLSADSVELTNNIRFVGPGNVTNFLGFAMYNGSYTSYMDNVRVSTVTAPPDLVAMPRYVTNSVMQSHSPADLPAKSFDFINKGAGTYFYTMTIANQGWLTSTTSTGTLNEADSRTNTIPLTFNPDIANWGLGASNTMITLTTADNGGATNWVQVTMNVMGLARAPAYYSNSVRRTILPPQQPVTVVNSGAGSFDYTLTITNNWILCATNGGVAANSSSGTLGAYSTNTIYLSYSNVVTNWAVGVISNTTVTIASTNGGGATNNLNAYLKIVAWGVSNLWYTNNVFVGNTPSTNNQTFIITNVSSSILNFSVTIPTNNTWLSCLPASGQLSNTNGTNVSLSYANTAGFTPGASNTTIWVQDSDNPGVPAQLVAVTLNLMKLTNDAPEGGLTNTAMRGKTPPSMSMNVINPGGGSYSYTVFCTNSFVTNSPAGIQTNGPYATNIVALTFPNTTAWLSGSNTTMVIISTNGGGGYTNLVNVQMQIMDMLVPRTNGITNAVMQSQTPPDMTMDVVASGTGTFNFAVANTTNGWLSFSNNTGAITAPGTSTVTLKFSNTVGWAVGTRSNTTILVTSTNGGGNTQAVGVVLTVMNLALSTNGLTNIVWLGNTPSNQTFEVWGRGTGVFNYTISFPTNAGWVTNFSTNMGTITNWGTNTITNYYAATTNFAPGASNATIRVISTNGGGATQSLAVVLNVMTLLYPQNPTNNQFVMRGNVPAANTLIVSNAGPKSYTYTYTVFVTNSWLTNSPTGMRTNVAPNTGDTINLSFTNAITNWLADTYSNAAIKVLSTNFGGATNWMTLNLKVVGWGFTNGVPILGMSNDVMLGRKPANQNFILTNAGTAALTCTVASTEGWLTNAPAGEVNLPVGQAVVISNDYQLTDPAIWAPGASNATVNLSSGGFTQSVNVVLNVMQMRNNAEGGLTNYVMEGTPPQSTQPFVVSNAGPGSFTFTNTPASGAAWGMTLSSTGSVGSYGASTMTVTYDSRLRTPSTNTASISVASTNGGGDTNTVSVTLIVTERPAGSSMNFYAATNGAHLWPYTNWTMAATNIADVLAIVRDGNNVFLSNGTFNLTNTLTITNSINFQGGYWDTNAASTILAGDGTTNCLVVNSTGAFVSAMTIRNGRGGPAGGVYMANGGTLSNCWIAANTSEVGGVLASNNALVINCVVTGNVGNVVGGLDLEGAIFRNSTIAGNVSTGAAGYGGGVAMGYQAANLVSNCVIQGNAAINTGGGAAMFGGEMADCSVLNNIQSSATGGGGGVTIMGTAGQDLIIRNCWISSNTAAGGGGGGVLFTNAPAYSRTLRNCLISSNAPDGVYQSEAAAAAGVDLIESCTIATNTGTGLRLLAGQTANVLVRNTIIYFNQTNINASLGATTNAFFNNCAFYDIASFPANQGNLTNDPAFGADYRLNSSSPCLGTGTNQNWMTNAVDLARNPRLSGPIVDMGAYAYQWDWVLTSGGLTNQFSLTNQVMRGRTPSVQPFNFVNRGAGPLDYVITNANWLSGSCSNGTAAAGTTNTLQVVYAVTTGWTPGTSNSVLIVTVTNQGSPQTRTVPVVLQVMDLKAGTNSLTSSIMSGGVPTNRTIVVSNSGAGQFNFTVTNALWMSGSSTNGILGPSSNRTININYSANIANWGPCSSNQIITIASTNGGGATQEVSVTVNVMQLRVNPTGLTNSVLLGGTPGQQSFTVENLGGGTFYYTINRSATWATLSQYNGLLGPSGLATIQVTYDSTVGWNPGARSLTLTVASTNGGDVTQTVVIDLNVVELLPPVVTASKGVYADKIRVEWVPAENATSYQVFRHTENDSLTAISLEVTADTLFDDTDTTTTQGRTYYYWVKSTNSMGISAFSDPDTGSRLMPVPTGVSATKREYTDKVRVTWSATTGASGYQVWRNTESNTVTATLKGSPATTTYDDTSAIVETTYYYWVRWTNAYNVSGFSVPDTGIRETDLPAPAAPTGLTASQGAYSDKVALTWTAPLYATSYEVWKSTVSDSSTATNIADPTSASYDDTAAAGGIWYYYWVKAKNTTGASGFSTVASGYRLDLTLVPLFGDFDGDRKADPAVYQLGTGKWFVRCSLANYATSRLIGFGGMGYTAFVADFDGDRKVDLGIYNPTTGDWQIKLSGSSYNTTPLQGFGGPGIVPVNNDFDGDLKADPGIYNTVSGMWRIMLSGQSYGIATIRGFGGAGVTPVPGYFDADNLTDPAIYGDNTGNWQIQLSASGYAIAPLPGFGGTGSTPLVADFDGDGKVDPAFYKASSRAWFIKLSNSGYGMTALSGFGGAGYVVGAIDFDGDGKADPAMYQDSTRTWFIKLSGNSYGTATLPSGYTP